MRGRKPKPERLRNLQGRDVRIVGGSKAPAAPRWLKGEAKSEWKRRVGELADKGLVDTLDVNSLAVYCKLFARWRRAEELLEQEGFTVPTRFGIKRNPLLAIVKDLEVEMRRWAAEFGFTPAARSRIVVPRGEGEEEDAFESFLDSSSAGSE